MNTKPEHDPLAHEVFNEAKELFTAFCIAKKILPEESNVGSRLLFEWKKPHNPAVRYKLCLYWDKRRIGTVLARHDIGHGPRIYVTPNGWRAG